LVDPDLKADIHSVMQVVEQSILDSVQKQETIQAAPKELSGDQSAVLVALQQALGRPGIDRARVLNLLTALSRPLLSAPVKEARQALLRMQRGGDVEAFLAVCESVAEKYAPKPPTIRSNSEQSESTSSKENDLRLICFEFLA
jgi:hypothetical protein